MSFALILISVTKYSPLEIGQASHKDTNTVLIREVNGLYTDMM